MNDFEKDLALAAQTVDALEAGLIPDDLQDEVFATVKGALTVAVALLDGCPEEQRLDGFRRALALAARLEGVMGQLWCAEGSQIFRRAAMRAWVTGAKALEVRA